MLLLILSTRDGPQNQNLPQIEYRFIQASHQPNFTSSALIHSYIEIFQFDWDAEGASFYEVILLQRFDQNASEVQILGDNLRVLNKKYDMVSKAVLEDVNHRELRNALLSIGYDTGKWFLEFENGGREAMIAVIEERTRERSEEISGERYGERDKTKQREIARVARDIFLGVVERYGERLPGISEEEGDDDDDE